jgi:hypothetical protein
LPSYSPTIVPTRSIVVPTTAIQWENIPQIPYDDIFRYNEQYIGKYVKFRGQILQTQLLYGDNYVLRVGTKKSEYSNSYYDDVIWVNYKGPRVLEDDIIDMWGKVKGLKEYTAVLGNTVTIPEIDAVRVDYIEKSSLFAPTIEIPTYYPTIVYPTYYPTIVYPTYYPTIVYPTYYPTIVPSTMSQTTMSQKCDIVGRWTQTLAENTPVTGVYIQIYSDNRIEIYLNNQLRSWGTWWEVSPNQYSFTWTGGVDVSPNTHTFSVSPDCRTFSVTSALGEHSTFVKQ